MRGKNESYNIWRIKQDEIFKKIKHLIPFKESFTACLLWVIIYVKFYGRQKYKQKSSTKLLHEESYINFDEGIYKEIGIITMTLKVTIMSWRQSLWTLVKELK